jgi:hypothetical protein
MVGINKRAGECSELAFKIILKDLNMYNKQKNVPAIEQFELSYGPVNLKLGKASDKGIFAIVVIVTVLIVGNILGVSK